MSLSASEKATTQFYEWEGRGRGWFVFDAPVDLEPPFQPFFFHTQKQSQYIDDGKRPTILSSIVDVFKPSNNQKEHIETEEEDTEIKTYIFECDEPLVGISISLPKEQKVGVTETEQLLILLSDCEFPVSFEIIANHTNIYIQLVCRQPDALFVYSQLQAFFPTAVLKEQGDDIYNIIKENSPTCVIDYGLSEEFMLPIYMADKYDPDPLIGIFGMLENLRVGEQAIIQILFKGTVNSWTESIIRSVTDSKGDAFFANAPEMLPLAKEKVSRPLLGVSIRCVGQTNNMDEVVSFTERLGNTLCKATRTNSNILIPLSNDGYDFETHLEDVLLRQTHRIGMLLNSRELATIVHPPAPTVVSNKLERDTKKTKASPIQTQGHQFILGTNIHQGISKTVSLEPSQRLKHMHVIGATGTGKSTFLLNCIRQDIYNNNGLAVLDPHGDLIEAIITHIPESRYEDVIIIDPSDSEYPVGFNILKAHSDIEKEILSSDLVAAFRRLSTSWGDQMNSVLANAILAFLENTQEGTLIDLRRFLIEPSYRHKYVHTISDPSIIYYWLKEYPLLKSSSIGPILTRLDSFLRPRIIRNMVAQKSSLDFEDILDTQKILLMKLSQGMIGNENSYLLGTVMVSKIQQAAMARQAKRKEHRPNFYLYIDEFQNFITPSMSAILSGARKYHLGLILAHQDMQQLIKHDSELASSVVSNSGTRICFRVGDQDAKRFEDSFSYFESKDLQNLATGEAIVRVDRPDFDFNITTSQLPKSDQTIEIYNKIIEHSRKTYSTPREEVEEILKATLLDLTNSIPQTETKSIIQKEEPIIIVSKETMDDEIPVTTKTIEERKEISQHRYLQTLIKKMAESRGFRAGIEEPTIDGKGRVDVVLERNGKRIACEVSVTTEDKWEMHNIEKCINSGYDIVIVCSNDTKNLQKIQKLIDEKLDKVIQKRILTLDPEALFLFLDKQVAEEASSEQLVKGYRVKVEYNAVSNETAKNKRESIIKAVTDSMKKIK